MSAAADRQRVRRSAVRVGVLVAIALAVIGLATRRAQVVS